MRSSSSRPGPGDAELHRARHDREHDRGARRHRRRLPLRRRDEALARRAGAVRGLHRPRDRRLGGRLRRGGAHRPGGARAARREALEPRERGPGHRGRGHRAGAGLRRLVRQLVVRGHGRRRSGAPRQADLGEARLGDGDARLEADPRPDHAVGHVRRPARGGSADARAGLWALRRHGTGAAVGRRTRSAPSTGTSRGGAARQTTASTSARRRSPQPRCSPGRHLRPARARPAELPERPPARPAVVQTHILAPAPAEEAASIEIPRGPNIKPPPEQKQLPDDARAARADRRAGRHLHRRPLARTAPR